MAYGEVFAALADRTRRGIFDCLRRREHAVGELAGLMAVSQPAVSQHLQVLRRAGLVVQRRVGNRRLYRAAADGLDGLRTWVENGGDGIAGPAAGRGDPPGRGPAGPV